MPALTYPEAMFIGLLQGVTELFPVSSLGHSVLIPAIIGGSWAQDLNVSRTESPYLAFIVGLHVATAAALICYFWRDWTRIVGGLLTSLRYRRIVTADERLAWMIILATIPVGIAGLALEHAFRVFFSKPVPTALFLCVNGLILIAAERRRSRGALDSLAVPGERRPGDDDAVQPVAPWRPAAAEVTATAQPTATVEPPPAAAATEKAQAAVTAPAVAADRRLARMSYARALGIGAMQIAALLPGISRDGIVTVTSMRAGLSREDAVRFSFLLSTPVILAAGVLKVPDLLGPLGAGIRGQVLAGSALSFAGAYLSVRFLTRYFSESRSLRPFGLYCLAAGLFSLVFVLAFRLRRDGDDMSDFGMTWHGDFPSSGGSPEQSPRSSVSAGGQAHGGYRLSAFPPQRQRQRPEANTRAMNSHVRARVKAALASRADTRCGRPT